MGTHRVKRGLDLPLAGVAAPEITPGASVRRVALLASDFVGMKPRMLVQEGDEVRLGQPLFEDRKNPGVLHVAPAAGRVAGVHRGKKRTLLSVVIEVAEDGADDETYASFDSFRDLDDHDRDSARALLVESGLWTALRTRPFSRVPAVDGTPRSIFVTAIDTHPLAPDPVVVLKDRREDFVRGLVVLERIADVPVVLCRAAGADLASGDGRVRVEEFSGKHPAGTVGYHIHVVDPVCRGKEVWHIGYQDVARIGRTFATGRLDVSRTVALAGPMVKRPRLLSTRCGAALADLVAGEIEEDGARVISGSVLSGRATPGEVLGYLGAYDRQISVLPEDDRRELLGWMRLGFDRFSAFPVFASWWMGRKRYRFTTTTYGSKRAMVPIGAYERVMPMDLMPTHLLRAICVKDIEWAEELGVLELDEEDLDLCTFVDPGKTDFGVYLREVLDRIHQEG